jgi:hypothetical protein
MLFFVIAPGARAARIIYVDADASAGGDGSSWPAAFKYLQDALAVADVNDEIRLAQGIYVPDRSTAYPGGSSDRSATFQLSETVAICGGYAGYAEPDPDARDVEAYETILSGDLLGNDVVPSSPEHLENEPTRSDNSYHVITADMMFTTVFLSGLTIVSAHADNVEHPGPCGGGVYAEGSSLTVVDCTFKNNYALWVGAGMYCRHLDFIAGGSISDCVFGGNSARGGPAIFNDHVYEAELSVTDCVFVGNVAADRGGAIVNHESNVNIRKCVFNNNSAGVEGGAIFNDHGNVRLTNCIISDNSAGANGGGIGSEHLRVWLTNCTVVGNEAVEKGGGLFDYVEADRRITNCIFWDNTAYEGPQMAIRGEVNVFIRYSCVQGGELDIFHDGTGSVHWADGNNTDDNPMFVDPGYWNAGAWVEGDCHLRLSSPCINAGDPDGDYSGQVDMDGEPRVMVGRVDMGADEAGEKQADLTRDGIIDFEDFGVFSQVWPENVLYDELCLLCDLFEDEEINALDLAEFIEDWLWQADWHER